MKVSPTTPHLMLLTLILNSKLYSINTLHPGLNGALFRCLCREKSGSGRRKKVPK